MRSRLLLAVLLPLSLMLALAVLLTAGGSCEPGASGDADRLSADAREAIPADIAAIYLDQARRWNIDAAFLAAIGAQETDHGRDPAASRVNPAGCQGLMQLGVGGRCGDFWQRNQCDGNHDGRLDILDPADNVCAAARGLRADKAAPPAGGSEAGYRQAACNYYGACADGAANYADEVMARAKRYGRAGGGVTDSTALVASVSDAGAGCSVALAAGTDEIVVDPGANRPGIELAPELVGFLRRMAEFLPRPPIVTTGSNHSPYTTSGNVSDHWDGHAADLGSMRNGFPATGGGYGDTIAEAAFLATGEPPAEAKAKAAKGGLYTIDRDGLRIQIIWKTYEGGDHYNHVHIGVRRAAAVA